RALAFGLRPTHLDSHQGLLYQRKDLFEALVRVSRAYRIPIGLARSQIEDHPFMADAVSPEDPLIDRTFDISPDVPPERWGDWYEEQFRGIGPGVTAVLVHLGLADAELRAATADRPTWGAEWRQRDFDFVMSDRFRRILEEGGFILTTWRAIGALPPPPASGEAAR
ncbi:MAG TPA: ChbG/HpnK family deacetylase, partial [Vicinamibacteria bacterium]